MKTLDDYFSIQVFLIVLRETIESAIIISVLLSFVHQSFALSKKKKTSATYSVTEEAEPLVLASEQDAEVITPETLSSQDSLALSRQLKLQIWIGGLLGLLSCLVIGAGILWVFYFLGSDLWSVYEHYWEGTFSILASIIISVMGVNIMRVSKMQEKWKVKLHSALMNSNYLKSTKSHLWKEKYYMFILPFVTTLREGMEAIVFVGGIGINENTPISSIVNSFVLAAAIGISVGFLLYRSGNSLSLQWFLVVSTLFLYLVAAGLFSKGVWNFELQRFINLCDGFDVSETGHGPGSYDRTISVWHVNCCNGELQEDGAFWMLMTAVLGWTNSATYGSVISYNLYWLVVIVVFASLSYEEKFGVLPIPESWQRKRLAKKAAYKELLDQSRSQQESEPTPRTSINSTTPLQGYE